MQPTHHKNDGLVHHKGKSLPQPNLGLFGRTEWAILGTVCGNIQALAKTIGERLAPRWKVAYLDADHKQSGEDESPRLFNLEWTDKIGFQRMDFAAAPGLFDRRAILHDQDLVLINGNHFEGARQIVALDRRKFDSLSRKITRLTQVDLFITKSGDPDFIAKDDLPDFLKNHLPHWADIPVLDWSEPEAIAGFLERNLQIPPLKGLVLAGGKSTRMGQDKAGLLYHQQPHWQFTGNLMQHAGVTPFISCRSEQVAQYDGTQVIPDTFTGLGPFGALLSAFRHDPNAAWLILPCDLPLMDGPTLAHLIGHRNPAAFATAYSQAESPGLPEPLIAIWEPKIYARMLQFLGQGICSPLEVLINTKVELIAPPNSATLVNVNTPGERQSILDQYFDLK